ncbi:alpha/beta hydrolase [Candidatus Collierbacteria bacterium]|nr:alpha/beta hydrolase [Candidatus Collierbacteria bacterium]
MQIVIDGRLLNYSEINPKGKTDLIILHGWAHTGALWQNLAQKLSVNIHSLLIDLPAFGSSQALTGNPNVPDYTQTIVDFIKKLGLKKPIILGHSFGGQIALDLAVKHPSLVKSLILVSPAGVRFRSKKTKAKLLVINSLKPLKKLIPSKYTKKFIHRFISRDYAAANPEQKIVFSNIVKYDLSGKFASIKTPCHLIWGSEDREISYSAKLITESIPDCRLYVLYNAGHNPHLTHTEKLAQMINQALNSHA